MITMLAYNLLSIIACGEVTVHTLHLGILARTRSKEAADELLLNGLLEVCDRGLINWRYHPAYGDKPAIEKAQESAVALLDTWHEVFGYLGPRTEEPSPSTISVELSKNADRELNCETYEAYADFLSKWYS